MYPYKLFAEIDLYTVLLAIGLILAMAVYRIMADKVQMNVKLFNFTLICALCAITAGYFFSVLFQAIYNIKSRGAFIIDARTGATFAGGLIGGAAMFIAVYFLFGRKYDAARNFFSVADCAFCGIAFGHSTGRIGCLMAGCCHGAETDAWYGIYMVALDAKVVPTQLFEAIFLCLLGAVLVLLTVRKKRITMQVYMLSYGIFRFLIEFLRADYRGSFIVDFLSPSQVISLLLIVGAVAVHIVRKRTEANGDAE